MTLLNPRAAWRPGLFVNIEVSTGESDVAVAVPNEAIQTVDGKAVVFVRTDGGFKAQPVETGRTDGKVTEILKGLTAGTVARSATALPSRPSSANPASNTTIETETGSCLNALFVTLSSSAG